MKIIIQDGFNQHFCDHESVDSFLTEVERSAIYQRDKNVWNYGESIADGMFTIGGLQFHYRSFFNTHNGQFRFPFHIEELDQYIIRNSNNIVDRSLIDHIKNEPTIGDDL